MKIQSSDINVAVDSYVENNEEIDSISDDGLDDLEKEEEINGA